MPRWICDQDRYALIYRDREAGGGVCACAYCARPVVVGAHNKNPLACELDHMDPCSKGGDLRNPNNLVVACHVCNHKKSDMSFATWMATGVADPAAAQARIDARVALSAQWDRFLAESESDGYRR